MQDFIETGILRSMYWSAVILVDGRWIDIVQLRIKRGLVGTAVSPFRFYQWIRTQIKSRKVRDFILGIKRSREDLIETTRRIVVPTTFNRRPNHVGCGTKPKKLNPLHASI